MTTFILIAIACTFVFVYIKRLKKELSEKNKEINSLEAYNKQLKLESENHRNKTFRVGDEVFTDKDNFQYNTPYFITQLYGGLGGMCAIIHSNRDADRNKNYSCMSYGIPLKDIQHERFPTCPTCKLPSK